MFATATLLKSHIKGQSQVTKMASPGVINPTAEQSQAPTYMIKKKFKTSELPLTASQRSTIEGLQHVIKKKGVWDTLRKKVWSEFIEGVSTLESRDEGF